MDAQKNLERVIGEIESSAGVIKRVADIARQVDDVQSRSNDLMRQISDLTGDIEKRIYFLSDREAQEAHRLMNIAEESKNSAALLNEQVQIASTTITRHIDSIQQTSLQIRQTFESEISSLKNEIQTLHKKVSYVQFMQTLFTILVLAGLAWLYYLK